MSTSSITVTDEGIYTVEISTDECTLSDEINVVFNELPNFSLGTDSSICEDSVLTLSADISGVEYDWSDASTSAQIEIMDEGIYGLTVTDENQCTYEDAIQITVVDLPELDIPRDTAICMGDEISLTLNSNDADVLVLWIGSGSGSGIGTGSGSTIMVSSAGEYVAQASNSGCVIRDTLTVSVLAPPMVDLGSDTIICSSNEFALDASVEGGSYEWSDGSSEPSLSISESGEYSVTVSIGSCMADDRTEISVVEGPVLMIEGIEEACIGQSIELEASGSGFDDVFWNTGEFDPSITVDQSGDYSVQVSDDQGCTAEESIEITFRENPTIVLSADTTLCEDEVLNLTFANQNYQYIWSDGIEDSDRTISISGTYGLTVRNEFDCDLDASIDVTFQECTEFSIYIPNAISPKSNQGNDKFYISVPNNIGIISWDLNIYDRWGNRVFTSIDPNIYWDGQWMNSDIKPGVYVYRLEVEYLDDLGESKEVLSGSVTLLE